MLRFRLLPVLLCLLLQLRGQQKLDYSFNHLDPSNGFPAKLVRSVVKDKNGFLWMITDKGLMKYNGHSGKFYGVVKDSSNKGLLTPPLISSFVDKTGLIWIGYAELCLSVFDPKTETFKHYFHKEKDPGSFPPGGAVHFIEDKKGDLWIAVWGGGLCKYIRETDKFKTYRPNEDKEKSDPKHISTYNTTYIKELKSGQFMLGSWEGEGFRLSMVEYFDPVKEEFTKLDLNAFTFESESEKIGCGHALRIVHCIYEAPNDDIWLGTFLGLVHINMKDKTIRRYSGIGGKTEKGGGNWENIIHFEIDNTGKIWCSTEVTGIMVVDLTSKKCSYINHSNKNSMSISADNIFSLYKDEDDNIWVCTSGGGVDLYTPLLQQFKFVDNERVEAERSNRAQGQTAINALAFSHNSEDVYLCHGNGLTVFNPTGDSVWRLDTREIFAKNRAKLGIKPGAEPGGKNVAFLHEHADNLGLCTSGGLVMYNKKTGAATFPCYDKYYIIDYDKSNEKIVAAARSKVAKDWNARLIVLDTNFNLIKEYSYPAWPFQDRAGWYAGGFVRKLGENNWFINFNNTVFYIFNDKNGEFKTYSSRKPYNNFPDSAMLPLTMDPDDNMWINCTDGIYKFDYRTGKTERYNDKFKIGKEQVFNVTFDRNNIIWIGLKQDLIKYDPKTGESFRYNQKLGLRTGGFARVHSYTNDRDELFILSSYGLLYFDPAGLKFSQQKPEVSISGIVLNKDTMNEARLESFLSSDHTLAYDQNYLTIEYYSKQMYSPGPKQYQYRLIGLDTTWNDNENRNYISYPGLAPGNYTLELKCTNVYSVQSDIFQFHFTVEPPFWKRWWFIMIEILSLLGMIILIVKRRERILEADKLKLENTVVERTKEVVEKAKEIEIQNHIIFEKNKELTDSIKYAERIQKALLAHAKFMNEHLPPHFVMFKPKAIVSGDFYWATTGSNGNFYLAVCDCTGHGVPGAFMSLLNISFLNEAISERNLLEPNKILDFVRQKLIVNLSSENGSDGMDGTLMCYDKRKKRITYASASNKPILIRKGQMTELPADKMPIGKFEIEKPFTLHSIDLEKGDLIYFYSDGYADQFGGEKGKKFKYRQLNELLLKISDQGPEQQKEILERTLETWRGNLEQVDDVMVVGILID